MSKGFPGMSCGVSQTLGDIPQGMDMLRGEKSNVGVQTLLNNNDIFS